MELHNRTLGQWLEHWAETTPDKEYIVYSDRDLRFTWSEFNKRVDDMAKGMLAIGITPWHTCRRMGDERTGLVDIPICRREDRCRIGHDQYEL